MSLITRCPACQTLFKVVPDQLRISEGWVRCGQCDEIFDASLHLLPAAPDAGMPALRPEGPAVQYEDSVAALATRPSNAIEPDAPQQPSPDELALAPEQLLTVAAADATERLSPAPIQPSPLTAVPAGDGAYAAQEAQDGPESERGAELSDVSFLRDNRASSFRQKPFMQATLVSLGFALVLGLAGQIVFHERDRMVALQPGLRPWLLALCGPFHCALSPLRQIESIVIESASFAKIRGDSYRLNFTLKNTAATALAVPAIELSLTDSLDQPAVRRVFLPAELGVKSDTLAAGSEWQASVAVAVKAAGMADRIAGYRLLAFYP